jgi:hypothetical protein
LTANERTPNEPKGRFIHEPESIQILRGNRVRLLSHDGRSAWRGDDGREIFDSLEIARAVLASHGYTLSSGLSGYVIAPSRRSDLKHRSSPRKAPRDSTHNPPINPPINEDTSELQRIQDALNDAPFQPNESPNEPREL